MWKEEEEQREKEADLTRLARLRSLQRKDLRRLHRQVHQPLQGAFRQSFSFPSNLFFVRPEAHDPFVPFDMIARRARVLPFSPLLFLRRGSKLIQISVGRGAMQSSTSKTSDSPTLNVCSTNTQTRFLASSESLRHPLFSLRT